MINRISIVGGPGAGKTTLSNILSDFLEIPVLHIDGIFYKPNWVEIDKGERDKKILEFSNKEKWIIDGTYSSTLKQRFDKSDLIIFLDYTNMARIKGILQRFLKYRGREKEEIPGCNERLNYRLIKYTWNYNKNKRPFIMNNLNSIDSKKILIFKNRKELNIWLEKVAKLKSIQL